jgi:hypothetical protein
VNEVETIVSVETSARGADILGRIRLDQAVTGVWYPGQRSRERQKRYFRQPLSPANQFFREGLQPPQWLAVLSAPLLGFISIISLLLLRSRLNSSKATEIYFALRGSISANPGVLLDDFPTSIEYARSVLELFRRLP